RKDGETIWCEWYHSCLLDEQGRIVSILSFVQDVSSRIQAEERLQYLATRDALTGLPNRVLLQERLTQAIAKARRVGQRVGVLFIDLDRFKNVNDTLGHRIGDELLKRVTAALSHALRETDLLARLGGDEFMVIVEDFDDPEVLNRIAQKVQDAVSQPFEIEEHDIYVTSSTGISVYPDDGDAPEDLAQRISEIVREAGCKPEWVELEVTESSLLHDLDSIKKVLQHLREEGFAVAIVDFGTGYSSLSHLKHFPIDTLKIDISFIADIETDPGDAAITEAIIALARGLGLRVVAEGVATREQLHFHGARGCHCFQGFWVSEALPADKF